MEQNRLLIITLQESHTWINFGKIIFLLNHTTYLYILKVLKCQSDQYNDTKDIKKIQI